MPPYVKKMLDMKISSENRKYLTFRCLNCLQTFTKEVQENSVQHFCSTIRDIVSQPIQTSGLAQVIVSNFSAYYETYIFSEALQVAII